MKEQRCHHMWIVFLEISPSFSDAFSAAHELGANVLHLSAHKSPNFAPGQIGPTKTVHVERWDIQQVQEIIRREIGMNESIASWTLLERLAPLAAKLNEAFQPRGHWPSDQSFWITKNKLLMRKRLEVTNLNPKYSVIERGSQLDHPLPGVPAVLKPFEGHSSIGVELLDAEATPHDFMDAANRSFSVLESLASAMTGDRPQYVASPTQALLVEEYVSGLEYSVEVFMTNSRPVVIGICGKSPMTAPYFEEVSYLMPANIEPETKTRLSTAAIEAVTSLGLNTGMAHVELKDGPDGPKILDIGLRLGGSGLTHDLVQTAYGINLVKAVLGELIGTPVDDYLIPTKHDTALLYLMQVGSGGTVAELPIPGHTPSLPPPIRFAHFVKVGDTLTAYPAYSGTPGFVLFSIHGQDSSSMIRANQVIDLCIRDLKFDYQNSAGI
jgi:ATP-grasp domain